MRKISEIQKKQIVGGAARRKASPSITRTGANIYNTRLHNISLISLATIPGLISLGEEIYSLFTNNMNYPKKLSSNFSSQYQGAYYNTGLSNNRRDFYTYASEAFRPMIRFSPYYYKSGITFGMPWMV